MRVKETVVVERDIHVAPCLNCGHPDIQLSDSGYSSFNVGGGKCKKCGREANGAVGCIPSMQDLANIWNAENDVVKLIAAERAVIAQAEKRITELEAKAGASLHIQPFENGDASGLMTLEDYLEAVDRGFISHDDGIGFWATDSGKSSFSTKKKQPAWATHVVWHTA